MILRRYSSIALVILAAPLLLSCQTASDDPPVPVEEDVVEILPEIEQTVPLEIEPAMTEIESVEIEPVDTVVFLFNDLRERIVTEPSSGEYQRVGITHYQQGNYLEAIEALQQAIRLNPHDPISYNYLGESYVQIGDIDTALAAFSKANEIRIQQN